MIEIPQEIKNALNKIGLDRAEQQVFMALIKQNMLGIQEITNKVNLPRSSVHLACESLLFKNVIKVHLSGKRRSFYIEKPTDIQKIIEYKEKKLFAEKLNLDEVLPKITSIYAISQEIEPIDIEEFQGEDGFIETFYRSLDQEKNGEVLRFGSESEYFTIAREKLKKYSEKRMKKKIYAKLILPDSPLAKEEVREAKFKMRETRVLPKNIYDPKVQMSTWTDHIAITVWDKGLHSVIIRNKSIADTLKQIFNIAWEKAK